MGGLINAAVKEPGVDAWRGLWGRADGLRREEPSLYSVTAGPHQMPPLHRGRGPRTMLIQTEAREEGSERGHTHSTRHKTQDADTDADTDTDTDKIGRGKRCALMCISRHAGLLRHGRGAAGRPEAERERVRGLDGRLRKQPWSATFAQAC
eukprot:54538-Rhodomonas_salina.1